MNSDQLLLIAGFATGFVLSAAAVLAGCAVGFTAHILSRRLRRALDEPREPEPREREQPRASRYAEPLSTVEYQP
jgi:hypothetical protein